MTDLTQISYEVHTLAGYVTDNAAIARHINKVHGTNYDASNIEKILLGLKPTSSMPRTMTGSKMKVAEPIAWTSPISTPRPDPLASATLAYIERNRAKIEALRA